MRSHLMTMIASLFLILIIGNTMKVGAEEIPADQLQAHQHAVATIEKQGGVYYETDRRMHLDPKPRHVDLKKWEGSDLSIVSDIHGLDMVTLHQANGPDLQALDIPGLRWAVFMGRCTFTDEEFIDFVNKSPKLEILTFQMPENLTDKGIACLGDLEHFRYLQIMNANMTDEGIKHLPQGLQAINIVNCDITPQCLQTLGKRPHMEAINLGTLSGIKDSDVKHLTGLRRLENLDIRHADLTNDGLRHIAKLQNLEYLHVGGSKITTRGAAALKDLPKLGIAYFHNTSCSNGALDRLEESLWGEDEKGINFHAYRTKFNRRR